MVESVAKNNDLNIKHAYKLIGGECYVHGLVDGQSLESQKEKISECRTFA